MCYANYCTFDVYLYIRKIYANKNEPITLSDQRIVQVSNWWYDLVVFYGPLVGFWVGFWENTTSERLEFGQKKNPQAH